MFIATVLSEGLFESRDRFRADRQWTAVISPYVRFGELTARVCWARAHTEVRGWLFDEEKERWKELKATFLRRFLWRDLAYWHLWRFPDSPHLSVREQYEAQTWGGTKK